MQMWTYFIEKKLYECNSTKILTCFIGFHIFDILYMSFIISMLIQLHFS